MLQFRVYIFTYLLSLSSARLYYYDMLSPLHCDTPNKWLSEYSIINSSFLWPNARVAYILEPNFTSSQLYQFGLAISEYSTKTCIRLEHRLPSENIFVRIELDKKVCGVSEFCYKGRSQYLKVGISCSEKSTFVHQLGHTLCLTHEHQRIDRDEYLDFTGCPPEIIPPKDGYETKGKLFDYTSQMHAPCGIGYCWGGKPKLEDVHKCGRDVKIFGMNGLSVLDADKLNEMYNCQGCHRHRWRNTKYLSETDKLAMIPFGHSSLEDQPLYLCRAYIHGEISPGTYRLDHNVCHVPFKHKVYQISDHVQVFTLPQIETAIEANKHSTYRTLPVYHESLAKPVPVGRSATGAPIYAAMTNIRIQDKGNGWKKERIIGKLYGYDDTVAFVPFGKVEINVDDFDILVCSGNANI